MNKFKEIIDNQNYAFGFAGSIENYEDIWEQSNNANIPFLPVNPFQVDGKPAPLPQRMNSELIVTGKQIGRAHV